MRSLRARSESKSFIARKHSVFSLSFVSICLVLFVFIFFSLRIKRKTTWEQVCQIRLTFLWHFRFLRSLLPHPEDEPGWGWTTASELLKLHPASGSLLASLILLCTCCGSLQCHQHVASAASVLAHKDTVFLLQSTCQAQQAALTVSNVEARKRVSGLGFFVFIFNPSFALKQSRSIMLSIYMLVCQSPGLLLKSIFWSASPLHTIWNWLINLMSFVRKKIWEITNIPARQRLLCDLDNGWMPLNL